MSKSSLTLGKFKGLFKSFYPSLCLFANSYLNNEEASKDVVQEVFIKIWEKEPVFKNKTAAKSYLYIMVKNRCLDMLKSKHLKRVDHNTAVESLELVSDDSYFNREVVLVELSSAIEKAINSLPYKCSRIIDLSLKQYSNKEIADILSLSTNTVKTQKKIAYQKLRPLLVKYHFLLLLLFKV